MPLYLVPPGTRIKRVKGRAYPNRYFLIRGSVLGGDEIEVSAKTADPALAEIRRAELELALLKNRVPGPGEEVTFGRAAELYIAYKQPSPFVQKRIRLLAAAIGEEKPVGHVQHADLVAAAEALYPGRKNETKNRWVIKPGAAVLHYAAENHWCAWLRIRKLEEGPRRTRAASAETAKALLRALEEEARQATTPYRRTLARKKRLLILWLFKHGNRVSDPLRLDWEAIDLKRRVYTLLIGKTRTEKEKPLDSEVWEALANDPEREGPLFPWRTRSGVYKWLRPLCRKLGVRFTPHMARHYLGTALNARGAGLRTIMGALDHSDPQSSIRYQDADLEIVRSALASPDKLSGKRRKRA